MRGRLWEAQDQCATREGRPQTLALGDIVNSLVVQGQECADDCTTLGQVPPRCPEAFYLSVIAVLHILSLGPAEASEEVFTAQLLLSWSLGFLRGIPPSAPEPSACSRQAAQQSELSGKPYTPERPLVTFLANVGPQPWASLPMVAWSRGLGAWRRPGGCSPCLL